MSVHKATPTAGEAGFTLLEIMVVVVIIGLLAAIVAPTFVNRIDDAAVARAKSDIRNIETSLNLFRLDNFKYPTTDAGLEALFRNPGEEAAPNWRQYLPQMPTDPWNHPYQYLQPGQHGEFDVFSYGADGREGGEGVNADIGNWDLS
jgi:general secretion pathway protein G